MKPGVWNDISKRDRELFAVIEEKVNRFPERVRLWNDKRGRPIELSCHILARAFANVFDELTFVDGRWSSMRFEHSWLVTQDYGLIDVYPVGTMGGPLLLWDHPTCRVRPAKIYVPDRRVTRKIFEHMGYQEFMHAVAHATELLRDA